MANAMRTFEDFEAKRASVPLMIGLCGPSGGGKTYSALRLAGGIQRVTGGDIFMIDTEARRGLHYADRFKFRHLPFAHPFGPLDYLAAAEHCVKRGAKVIIIDSMSHEHEGPGGVLEMHAAEVERLSRGDESKAERVKMLAWGKPKADRRRMINTMLQLPVSTIFCFRAKEKLKIERGKEPTPLGFMPIAGEEFIYEMTINCLLLPKADGVPTWQSNEVGERATMKLPAQFRSMFAARDPLSEDLGEAMARWADGETSALFKTMGGEIDSATNLEELKAVHAKINETKKLTSAEKKALGTALQSKKTALATPAAASGADSAPEGQPRPGVDEPPADWQPTASA